MPNTPNWAIPYAGPLDAPNGYSQEQAMALAVDAALTRINALAVKAAAGYLASNSNPALQDCGFSTATVASVTLNVTTERVYTVLANFEAVQVTLGATSLVRLSGPVTDLLFFAPVANNTTVYGSATTDFKPTVSGPVTITLVAHASAGALRFQPGDAYLRISDAGAAA